MIFVQLNFNERFTKVSPIGKAPNHKVSEAFLRNTRLPMHFEAHCSVELLSTTAAKRNMVDET
jgi:hypothetical protein